MIVKDFVSQCSPELNAKILRGIENLVCRYCQILADGWRCCIEFQRSEDVNPYYKLDLQSNAGGGEFAPVKMAMLKRFPKACGTGSISLQAIIHSLKEDGDIPKALFDRLCALSDVSKLTDDDWEQLKNFGITRWYGGIRIPYDILVTDVKKAEMFDEELDEVLEQKIEETRGEIRITFSGAKEWQDSFFCFCIFERVQSILNSLWSKDQIWYNLREFKNVPALQFWVEALTIAEAPED